MTEEKKSQLDRLAGLKADLGKAREAYLLVVHKAPAGQVKSASDAVRELQRAISDCITEGANPCPKCLRPPHGIHQTEGKYPGFEIGCLTCHPFKWIDRTTRYPRVRSGLLPRHAVEAWNAGPSAWWQRPPPETQPQGG